MTFTPCPKPIRRKPIRKPMKRKMRIVKTHKAAIHLGNVKGLPCLCCGASEPSDAHHVRSDSMGRPRSNDFATIPLCKICHQTGKEAFHNGKSSWEDRNCKDYALIPQTLQAIYGPRWSEDH